MRMCVERLAAVRREEEAMGRLLGRVKAVDQALKTWNHDLYLAGFHLISNPAMNLLGSN